jgi:hypothetical protein
MIEHKTSEKKLQKIEKLIAATFSTSTLAEVQALKPERASLVYPVLLQSPEHFSAVAANLSLLKIQLSSKSWSHVSSKFHSVYKLLLSNNYHANIARAFEAFVNMFIGVLES